MPYRLRRETFLDRVIAASVNRPISTLVGYAVATLAVVATATLRAFLGIDLLPWLLYVPIILACSLTLPGLPAVWALLLSAGMAMVTIYEPGHRVLLSAPQWGATGVFLAVGSAVILLGQQLRSSFEGYERLATDYEESLEISEARRERLSEREGFLSGILASSSDCITVLDLDGRLRFMSDGGKKVMEVRDFADIEGHPWENFWEGSCRDAARRAVDAARAGKTDSFTGQAPTLSGDMRWWDVAITPIVDAKGKPERILSVSRNVTDARSADDQVKLLNRELGHRLKNTLALVQAIVSQTLREGADLTVAKGALMNRLVALGQGADILTANSWEAAEIGALARSVLGPHGLSSGRITIDGPVLHLSSRLALSLSLALHELATNAIKYGALSNDVGSVAMSWKLLDEADPDGLRVRVTWTESGGPDVVEPERTGFGSLLIGRALSSNFKGETKIDYRQEGVIFTLDAPFSALNEMELG